ncbi:hypothetical protein [Stenotrophomonas sp.]|uniref:hypothetical protein n=1 Tax=Stenotrophomonas sp. TaxID=69392 RepID=UPI002897EE79|nr:hypothetical protein [Stenotrophomonas sp.]
MVATVAVFLAPCTAVASRKTTVYVRDAVAISPQCIEVGTRELQFACHRVTPGEGIVVAEHRYGRSWNIDSSTYRKLTIRLPAAIAVGDLLQMESGQAGVFFSEGSAAFAGKRGCYGRAQSGSVEVLAMSVNSIRLKVHAVVSQKSPLEWRGDCDESFVISQIIKASRRAVDELTAWEGRPSADDSPFSEANPSD